MSAIKLYAIAGLTGAAVAVAALIAVVEIVLPRMGY